MMSSPVANVVMISTCCERWFNAQEEMLALSGTQRHVDGPLHKYASATYSQDGVICKWSRAK